MKLLVQVIECPSLYSRVLATIGEPGKLDTELLKRSGIDATIELSPALPVEYEPVSGPYDFRVCVMHGDQVALARLAQLRTGQSLADSCAAPPVIVVLPEDANLQLLAGHTGPVDQWLFANYLVGEFAFRVIRTITLRQYRTYRFGSGIITLSCTTRTIELKDKKLKLSPSELSLAQLFLDRPGTVVSLDELVDFFSGAGKSSAMNNIRVTIFQLRLKLEELSNRKLTIATVYRRGYALKQASPAMQDAGETLALAAYHAGS